MMSRSFTAASSKGRKDGSWFIGSDFGSLGIIIIIRFNARGPIETRRHHQQQQQQQNISHNNEERNVRWLLKCDAGNMNFIMISILGRHSSSTAAQLWSRFSILSSGHGNALLCCLLSLGVTLHTLYCVWFPVIVVWWVGGFGYGERKCLNERLD